MAAMAVGLALLCGGVASAQTPPPRKPPVHSILTYSSQTDGLRALDAYARCAVGRRYAKARAAVDAVYGSPEQVLKLQGVQFNRGSEDPCVNIGPGLAWLNYSSDALAGALARALIAHDYPDLATVIDVAVADEAAERATAGRAGAAEAFGRCIVRRNPAGVAALMKEQVGSDEGKAAIARIRGDLSPCLANGVTLALEPIFLRNATATAAYHLAQEIAPRGVDLASRK